MSGLETRPEWFVLGPLLGLIVIAMYALLDQRVGIMGGVGELVERATGRISQFTGRGWFVVGVVIGGLGFALLVGHDTVGEGYGWLTREFSSDLLVVGILILAGVLIGYGTRLAGGCTSGNGIGGCSTGSPASFTATASFMGTAIGVSLLIQAVT